jgi:hypothetical protein
MSRTAWLIGVLAFALLMAAGAWPTVRGTVGFGAAGLGLLLLFLFVVEDDERRGR